MKLSDAILKELEKRARQFGSRINIADTDLLKTIADDVANEATHEAKTGVRRSNEWMHIEAQAKNITAADAELFRKHVHDIGRFVVDLLKAAL